MVMPCQTFQLKNKPALYILVLFLLISASACDKDNREMANKVVQKELKAMDSQIKSARTQLAGCAPSPKYSQHRPFKYFTGGDEQTGFYALSESGCEIALHHEPGENECVVWQGSCEGGRANGSGTLEIVNRGTGSVVSRFIGNYRDGLATGYGKLEGFGWENGQPNYECSGPVSATGWVTGNGIFKSYLSLKVVANMLVGESFANDGLPSVGPYTYKGEMVECGARGNGEITADSGFRFNGRFVKNVSMFKTENDELPKAILVFLNQPRNN